MVDLKRKYPHIAIRNIGQVDLRIKNINLKVENIIRTIGFSIDSEGMPSLTNKKRERVIMLKRIIFKRINI